MIFIFSFNVLFEQKTAYEMSISDWSSDVCSSDLIFLVQGWDESQSAREFYAAFLGSGVKFHMHAASKQSVFALVGAGLGVTLATVSQSEVVFPGVVYRPIDEADAWLQVELAWIPDVEDAVLGRFLAFMRRSEEKP